MTEIKDSLYYQNTKKETSTMNFTCKTFHLTDTYYTNSFEMTGNLTLKENWIALHLPHWQSTSI